MSHPFDGEGNFCLEGIDAMDIYRSATDVLNESSDYILPFAIRDNDQILILEDKIKDALKSYISDQESIEYIVNWLNNSCSTLTQADVNCLNDLDNLIKVGERSIPSLYRLLCNSMVTRTMAGAGTGISGGKTPSSAIDGSANDAFSNDKLESDKKTNDRIAQENSRHCDDNTSDSNGRRCLTAVDGSLLGSHEEKSADNGKPATLSYKYVSILIHVCILLL